MSIINLKYHQNLPQQTEKKRGGGGGLLTPPWININLVVSETKKFFSCVSFTLASSSLLFPMILSLINRFCSSCDRFFHFSGRGLVVSIIKLSSSSASVTQRQYNSLAV